jgi:hypothetical protein
MKKIVKSLIEGPKSIVYKRVDEAQKVNEIKSMCREATKRKIYFLTVLLKYC